ncbi:hypothetical protein M0R45_000581 [Rubus argutus]|uniref:Uncharacterized protein n=1 Tax=Rubus argutus TaxID=59490 RepID=A0AAW1VLF4_RUBAR
MCSPPKLIGQKRQTPLALITAGKYGRVLDLVPPSSLMDEALELYLHLKVGALVVSPLKRKCGRPVGSKNRPKGAKSVKRNLSVPLVGPRKKRVPKPRVSGTGMGVDLQLVVVVEGEGVSAPS